LTHVSCRKSRRQRAAEKGKAGGNLPGLGGDQDQEDAEYCQAKNTCVVVDLLAASCERLSAEQPVARFQVGQEHST
jgi:hypothetical protein